MSNRNILTFLTELLFWERKGLRKDAEKVVAVLRNVYSRVYGCFYAWRGVTLFNVYVKLFMSNSLTLDTLKGWYKTKSVPEIDLTHRQIRIWCGEGGYFLGVLPW